MGHDNGICDPPNMRLSIMQMHSITDKRPFRKNASIYTTTASAIVTPLGYKMYKDRRKYQRSSKKDVSYSTTNTTSISHQLGEADASICTLTWFKGDFTNTKSQLEKRMILLIQKNPWLQHLIFTKSFFGETCQLLLEPQTGNF